MGQGLVNVFEIVVEHANKPNGGEGGSSSVALHMTIWLSCVRCRFG